MECILAIDQGTQSTRVFLFDKSAQPIASHQIEFPQIYPKAGWCEHDPLIIWGTVQACIQQVLQKAHDDGAHVRVAAVGITNQRETTLVWSRSTGLPLHNAVVWLDSRTSDICHAWEQRLEGGKQGFRSITGLPVSTYFSAYKVQWLYENVPAVAQAVDAGDAMFGTMDSWLVYQLTGGAGRGVHVTDVTNASRTNLMHLGSRRWHEPILPLFHVTPQMLPRICSNSEHLGSVAAGPLEGVPITGCLGDQMAAVLGQRCGPGEAKNTYGTGCFMLLNTGLDMVPSAHGLLTTMAYQLGPSAPPHYALEGSVAVAGLGVSWLRDNLRLIGSAAESEEVALQVPDTGGVYFVPAFSGLLAPHWQEDARGVLLGMTGFTTRGHVVRAMLEAICFQTADVLGAMRADADMSSMKVLRVDGGATKNNLLMQLQANDAAPLLPPSSPLLGPVVLLVHCLGQSDILQVPVVRPHFQETTALGAALAAGLAVGMWDEAFVLTHPLQAVTKFTPAVSAEDSSRRRAHWKKAVSRCVDLADLGH